MFDCIDTYIVDDVKADNEKKLTGKNMHKKYKNEFTAIKGIVYMV
jgi:hypothetical protein